MKISVRIIMNCSIRWEDENAYRFSGIGGDSIRSHNSVKVFRKTDGEL